MPKPETSHDTGLATYRRKRDFSVTPEPEPAPGRSPREHAFVIQKHAATRLHYDFRLELDGVLLSWAVPKGPSFDPADKRMAIHVEDHPVSYGSFEGTIPPRQYGAGEVIVWDRGTWEPVGDPRRGLQDGKLVFRLHGQKLAGLWELVRIRKPGDRQDAWLLFKKRDEWARPTATYDVVSALPDSVIARPLGPLESREPADRATPKGADAAEGRIAPERLEGAVPAALPGQLPPQLATLAKAVRRRRRLALRDQVRRLSRDGAHRGRPGAADHARRPRLDREGRIAGAGARSARHRLGLARRRDRRAQGRRRARISTRCRTPSTPRTPRPSAASCSTCLSSKATTCGGLPWSERRALLEQLLAARGGDRVRFSAAFEAAPERILQTACKLGLEGRDRQARGCALRLAAHRDVAQAEVQRAPGVRHRRLHRAQRRARARSAACCSACTTRQGRLVYAGNVGTGWDARAASELHTRLARIGTEQSPFAAGAPTGRGRWTRRSGVETHWVEPRLVVEIAFAEWTPDGHIRHASFQGLRSDKPASKVGRERAIVPKSVARTGPAVRSPPTSRVARTAPAAGATRISNPERVIDPSTAPDQARPRPLLRERGRAHAAAPARPAGRAGARADRHRRRAVLPEARRQACRFPASCELDPAL